MPSVPGRLILPVVEAAAFFQSFVAILTVSIGGKAVHNKKKNKKSTYIFIGVCRKMGYAWLMPERFTSRILRLLARSDYVPLKERQLAKVLNLPDEDYAAFRESLRRLREEGQVVYTGKSTIALPNMANRIVGVYEQTSKGFGFVRPDVKTAQGDLFIPEGRNLDAVSGDRVVARVQQQGKRPGKMKLTGYIVEVLERAQTQLVGTLDKEGNVWIVKPDGQAMTERITVDDPGAKNCRPGDKVLVEILSFPSRDYFAHGVILERLGKSGASKAEMLGVIRRFNLLDKFSRKALQETRASIGRFNPDDLDGREDIRDKVIITIDPVDARDFDDAISIEQTADGLWELGVHIADVSYFISAGGQLDQEAYQRATSVYLPGQVLPMLPELLSNGVCSLQQDQDRFVKSAYIRLNDDGKVQGTRFANSVMRSTRRLTYEDVDRVLSGETLGCDPRVLDLLARMNTLARIIYRRRQQAGMLEMELPKAELIYDANGQVIDARPESTTFSHKMIEMFMVEANEAVARLLDGLNVPFLRRIHPEPDALATGQSARIVHLCGYPLPKKPGRKDLQALLASVRGKPESFLVNLAVLKSLQRAEYSPTPIGHYALASEHYAHFTSPIRRYPDLTVHRLLGAYLAGRLTRKSAGDFPDFDTLIEQGGHCSRRERNAEAAEDDLRKVKILQMLADHIGEETNAVVTGITNFGVFVQCERFLIDGLIKASDMLRYGEGAKGKKPKAQHVRTPGRGARGRFMDVCPVKLGAELRVRIAAVNIAARLLDLVPVS